MRRMVDAALSKDASNARLNRYEDLVLTRYEGKLRIVNLSRRPSTHTLSKASATSRKPASIIVFTWKFLDTLSTRLASCSVVLCLGLNPNFSSSRTHSRGLRRESWRVRFSRKICQPCLADLWVDTIRAAPGLSLFQDRTRERASKPPGSTAFEKSR